MTQRHNPLGQYRAFMVELGIWGPHFSQIATRLPTALTLADDDDSLGLRPANFVFRRGPRAPELLNLCCCAPVVLATPCAVLRHCHDTPNVL